MAERDGSQNLLVMCLLALAVGVIAGSDRRNLLQRRRGMPRRDHLPRVEDSDKHWNGPSDGDNQGRGFGGSGRDRRSRTDLGACILTSHRAWMLWYAFQGLVKLGKSAC
jgi:hypothetical protein